jgi:hypothetical protein
LGKKDNEILVTKNAGGHDGAPGGIRTASECKNIVSILIGTKWS